MDDFAPKYVDRPREGYFWTRAWKRGPRMPVRFYRPVPLDPDTGEIIDRWPALVAERDETEFTDRNDLLDIWPYCREITYEEWTWLKKVEWPLMKRKA